jgi:hypothetical protein
MRAGLRGWMVCRESFRAHWRGGAQMQVMKTECVGPEPGKMSSAE